MRFISVLVLAVVMTTLQGCCWLGKIMNLTPAQASLSRPAVEEKSPAVSASVKKSINQQNAELSKVAETTKTDKGLVVKLKGDVLFEKGKTTLSSAAVEKIKELGQVLAKYPKDKITVVGHTDNSGKSSANLVLSKKRAESVKAELVKQGVSLDKVSAVGKGDTEPIAPNDTPEDRAKNRRAELNIVPAE